MAGVVLLFGTAIVLVRIGALGNAGLRKAYVNPPRWLQVALFVVLGLLVWSHCPTTHPPSLGLRASALLRNWGALAAASLLLASTAVVVVPHLAYLLLRRRTKPAGSRPAVVGLAQSEFERTCEWLRTDDEITAPSDDVFGHYAIATRIADRLTQAAEGALGRCPTFALIGALGSGKSSILALVRYSLRARHILDGRILVDFREPLAVRFSRSGDPRHLRSDRARLLANH